MSLRARYRVAGEQPPERLAAAVSESIGGGPPASAGGASVASVEGDTIELDVSLERIGTSVVALLTALLGAPFELSGLTGLRLLDFTVPAEVAGASAGPAFGISGTRRLAQAPGPRPLIGSIIKPSVGLTPEQTAERVLELGFAGADFIKDDELMASPSNSPLRARLRAVTVALDRVAEQTGRRPIFAFNISCADSDELLRNHDRVTVCGGDCVMVSINHVGAAAVQALRARASVPIHAHRNGWGWLTRCPQWGMEFRPYAKAWRLLGVDHLHVNGFGNKFWEPDDSVAAAISVCLEPLHDVAPAMPVVSSGQWGGQAAAQLEATRTSEVIYLAGGGVQAHPDGPGAGLRAVRAAWEAALDGEPLADRARRTPELAASIEMFGGGHG